MGSPFWSEEQQRLFLEQQLESVQRPADLERYEAGRDNQNREDRDEELQQAEPPYSELGVTLQVDSETKQLISDSGNSGTETRGRVRRGEEGVPQLARLEARIDVSPGRRSLGYESLQSQPSTGVREIAEVSKDDGEVELVPDYARLPTSPVRDNSGDKSEAAGGNMQAMMAQMSNMMGQMLQEQLGPTLNTMMLHQARVESRLEVLEAATSRPMSLSGDVGLERALQDQLEGAPTGERARLKIDQAAERDNVHSSSSDVHRPEIEDLAVRFENLHNEEGGPTSSKEHAQTGKSERSAEASGGGPPTQGEIVIGGIRHAWSIGTGGLELRPMEEDKGLESPIGRVTAGDIFSGRASSPFERSKAAPKAPYSEPRPGSRTREAVSRELRPTSSDPVVCVDPTRKPKELGWMEQGRAELEQILGEKHHQTPKPPEPPRSITPVKPRIVYPFSPGGTEIRPPPPQRSPKRTYRTSPSPPRHPPGTSSQPEMAQVEPSSEMRQLAVMLGEAIKGSRGGENKVEDVKTIPELPKLEIKESERELSPLIAGDWVTIIGPSLRDLSSNATQWWDEVINVSKEFYDKWLTVGPMERLVMVPERPQRFNKGPFTRVEQRAISLLLKAIPTYIRDDLVSSRKLTSIEALCAILTTYQPGGLRERSALLKYLTSPEPGKSVSETLRGLRRWGRWRLRAHELGIGIPDATLLVGGLDHLTSAILQQHPDVLFRINTFRHMNNLDHVPTEVSAASLAQFLQAEFQALESGGGAKRVKLAKAQENQDQPQEPKGKEGKGKAGQKAQKGKGGEGQKKGGKGCYHWMSDSGCRLGSDCRFRHDREILNSSSDISSRCYNCSGIGHRSHECTAPSASAGEGNQGSSGSNNNKGKGGKGNQKGDNKAPVTKKIEEDPAPNSTAQLITAAEQLLDQMQVKALSDVITMNRVNVGESRTGLIDSGASNCLRRVIGEEAKQLLRRTVDLAQGTAELLVTPCGTLVSEEPVETIVALGPLIKLGCRLQWGDRECVLWHPKRGRIPVDIRSGCPRIAESLALELIAEIEEQRLHSVGAAIKAIRAQQTQDLPRPQQAIRNLVSAIERDAEVAPRLGEAVLALWPNIPKAMLGEITAWPQQDHRALPINRRKRKSLQRAKKTLLHLFAGESRKEIERKATGVGYEVVSIGEGEDIMAGQTFRFILEQAAEGTWDAIWAAPPCGTNSLCRYIQPGPPPLRGREGPDRWGLPHLSVADKKKVQISDEMYLRSLLVMLVSAEGRRRVQRPPTWSLAENPQDPEEYLSPEAELRQVAAKTGGLPSWFATPEFKIAADLLGMQVYCGDQGPYGHEKRKPTGWASTRPLPELRKGPGTGIPNKSPDNVTESWESGKWAKWAGGMIDLLMNLLRDSPAEQAKRAEVNWQAHMAAGHWPPLRQCRTCISAGARHRAHKRISNPASWVLSLDTIGPFKLASDETERNLRFALVACLLIPVDAKGKPVLGPAQQQDNDTEALAEEGQGHQDGVDSDTDLADALGIRAVHDEVEEEEGRCCPEEAEQSKERCEKDAEGMSPEERECRVPGLKWKEVHFIEVLKRKTPQAIVHGISRMLVEIRELGFPITRLHTDAGTEFINSKVRELAAKHEFKHTCASPQEPSSNGRVESAIGRIKALAKVHMHSEAGSPELWPLALRAAVASMKTQSLRSMGLPLPNVVPFGTRVQVLTRSWLRRQKQEWYLKARPATVLCPAALVRKGYVVRVGKQLAVVTKLFHGEEPKLGITTTQDKEGEACSLVVTLENQAPEPPIAHSIGPEARISGKSSRPDMSIRPSPKTRYKSKAPAPGIVPVVCRIRNEAAEAAEDRTADVLASEDIRMDQVIRFIQQSSYMDNADTKTDKGSRNLFGGRHFIFGAFRHGGVVGITNNTKMRPGMAKLLSAVGKKLAPNATFTTVVLSVNALTPPHKDSNNDPTSCSCWIPLIMPSQGGRLWTEAKHSATSQGQPHDLIISGRTIPGQLHPPQQVVRFNPKMLHGTEQWSSQDSRVVLLLYTVGCAGNLKPPHKDYLQQLGFALPQDKGGDPGQNKISTNKPEASPHSAAPKQMQQEPGEDKQSASARVDSVSSGEGLRSEGSVQVEGAGSREISDGVYGNRWCCLCEEGCGVDSELNCLGCGCNLDSQLSREESSPKPKNKNKNSKTQNPKKNCISPYKKDPAEKEACGHAEPEIFRLSWGCDNGDSVEWVSGPDHRVTSEWLRSQDGCNEATVIVREAEGSSEDLEEAQAWRGSVRSVGCCEAEGPVEGSDEAIDGRKSVSWPAGHEAEELLENSEEAGCQKKLVELVVVDVGYLEDRIAVAGYQAHKEQDRVEEQWSCSLPSWEREPREASPKVCFIDDGHELDEDPGRGSDDDKQVMLDEAGRVKISRVEECVHELEHEELCCRHETDADQLDVEDFARWLDETQLRISSMCEQELESWINDGPPEGEQGWEQRKLLDQEWQAMQDIRAELTEISVRKMESDLAALDQATAPGQQEVLQTRIVANHQVAMNWSVWEPCALAEITELINNKEALERSDVGYLQRLREKGIHVKEVPSKMIFSIKAPKGKLKARLVACGNFLDQGAESRREHKDAVFTESVSIEGLRVGLSFSVKRGYDMFTLDVKAAFLNAPKLPRDRRQAEELAEAGRGIEVETMDEIIALVPPRMLVTKRVFEAKTRLIVKRAVYGLDTSPRDWSLKRDHDLKGLLIKHQNKQYRLFQSFSESGLWLLSSSEPRRGFQASLCREQSTPAIEGWLAVYVDDILISAARALALDVIVALRTLWVCSDPETVGSKLPGLRFLGLDLFWVSEGILALSQQGYILELQAKYQDELAKEGQPCTPMMPGFDDELVEEAICPEGLRRTQAIVGELLWASIRTRPDVSYAVSRVASRTSKAPKLAYQAGLHILSYLVNSADCVLTYRKDTRPQEPEPCRRQCFQGVLQGFGDASFAPEAQKSMQCLQVYSEGNLVAWQAHRQPFMSQSSCEAELVALMDLANYTLAIGYPLEELLQHQAEKELLGDNLASIAVYTGTTNHWRTRHLKIRARAFHEKNCEGELPALHVAGEWNPADIGTKALQGARHWKLADLLGLFRAREGAKRVQGSSCGRVGFRECLLAVIMACCLKTAQAQPTGDAENRVGDWALVVIVFLIIVSAISIWECCRGCVARGVGGRDQAEQMNRANTPAPEEEADEPQPDHEDELVEVVHTPRPQPPPVPVNEQEVIPEQVLRRRQGQPVHRPEPDDEPAPAPPQAPIGEQFQGIVLGRYVDDVVLGIPAEVLNPGGVQANALPPRPPDRPPQQPAQGVRIRDFEEVRQQVLREEAERRILDVPVQPPLTVNPTWGPSPTQPTLRQVRDRRSTWGGAESAVYHSPPVMYRGDFYQVDLGRAVLIRWHCKARTRLFTPIGTRLPQPVELRVLTGERRSIIHEPLRQYMLDDTFRGDRATRALQAEWRGRTELRIDLPLLRQLQAQAQGNA